MFRMIVADDELLVRQLLKHLIQYDELELTLVDEAENGSQAYELIVREKPDIAIIDIRMPGMDGITLAKKVRDAGIDTYIILVSGHKQFEYAHEAMELGIQDYLLKPIKSENLNRVLSKACQAITQRCQDARSRIQMQSWIDEKNCRLQALLIEQIIQSSLDVTKYDIERLNSEYGVTFRPGYFQCMLICSDLEQSEDTTEKSAFILEQLSAAFSEQHVYHIHGRYQKVILYILNYPPEKLEAIGKGHIQRRVLLGMSELLDKLKITITLSLPTAHIGELNELLRFANERMNSRIFYPDQHFLLSDGICFVRPELRKLISERDEHDFQSALELFKCDDAAVLIQTLYQQARSNHPALSPQCIHAMNDRLLQLFDRIAESSNTSSENPVVGLRVELKNALSLQKMVDIWRKAIERYCELSNNEQSVFARFAKEYVCEHYSENIKLQEIASLCNINATYLSRVFKEETGESFSDYLIAYRIEMAKLLLKDVRLNISEVSEKVGYCDAKHFSKSFRSAVGITPKEYRKLYAR